MQAVCLVAGTLSGLLVSRSATKGTRVFRMQRDDELLRLMLLGEQDAC
jgi:radial spoke head protein 9